jgi:TPR repeat protein
MDISQAIKPYTLAANQGNGAAQNRLNQMYQHGKPSQISGITNNTD